MSRVLQIRRGTGAQNDNFTGLSGEITYDTDAKTIRVHDGQTLGGVALARADEIPESGGGSDFDIDSVPDEKWAEIFARVSPTPLSTHTSDTLPIRGSTYIEYIFSDIANEPVSVRAYLVCVSDAAGYVAGDETAAFGIGNYGTPSIYTFTDQNGLHVRLMIGGGTFWVAHKTSGVATNIATNEWKLKIRICC